MSDQPWRPVLETAARCDGRVSAQGPILIEPLQLQQHVMDAGPALVGILGQARADDAIERRREASG